MPLPSVSWRSLCFEGCCGGRRRRADPIRSISPDPDVTGGLVITMASWISHWLGAQLLTGRPQAWVVAVLVLGLLPWLLGAAPCCRRLSLIPMATALLWTLPLQLLHFSAMPLYALVANLLFAPLLALLTLLAMLSALLVLVGPTAVLPLMLWPVHQLAGLVITMAGWISHWPGAQLLTGRPQAWVVALLVLGLLPWLLGAAPCCRRLSLIPMATALLVHGLVQFGDGLVAVERFGRHWLLARHRGRAALVSTHGDARSCRMAKKLAAVHGHARLDWVMLLDPVATEVLSCWQTLAHRVEASQQGRSPIAIGQVLRSTGLSVQRLQSRSGALVMRVGHQRWQLVPSPQDLWALQQRQRSEPRQLITGTWLGFKPSAPQRRWLLKHGAGARFVGL